MNILITGANGFVGKNLSAELEQNTNYIVYKITRETTEETFEEYCKKADFVFHLAGVNRPKNEKEFMTGNLDFTVKLVNELKKHDNFAPVLITSSIQAELDNPYGKSKKAGEDIVFEYGGNNKVKTFVYRLPNLFGKWCRPNYNSVVATFSHNIANGLPIRIDNPDAKIKLLYIDDLINEFKLAMEDKEKRNTEGYCEVENVLEVTLDDVVKTLNSFKQSREDKFIPNMEDSFTKKLYSTYLSYLSENDFSYELKMNKDNRGSFTEFIKNVDRGQVSINISKPGITKGNHWHHTKNEKFLVVSGEGVIRFRKYGEEKVIEYLVNGNKLEVVDIPTGYTHNIENLGETDMVTVMWVNEMFDPNNPDTYYEEV
ncbi:NAD-dependent epimerase/dehydratase family protein [Salinicoccus halodurans]|uniref:Capsular biosynthesis protein n=1 Tax=Salinicoccus halodurans TaxID=407035 RepID=A0A0F7HIV5_9STAP|nr:NAD-dependent epimerase/dehydratase family protein [Salinicoccus halodurans]AKG73458.1 capsular biosynthesis protein [Salinicoccus halodurans]SFK50881.1 UDP-2-acetamido-2,6-beta-L-arabino-hexul-4-ose reductase [Salinicoccus halodurans]